MNADGTNWIAKLGTGAVVKVNVGRKAGSIAADDRQHQLQVVPDNAHHAFRAAADADPDRHRLAQFRENLLIFQGTAGLSRPCDARVAGEFGEDIKALLEKLFVVVQIMAKEGIAFGKRPAPEDGFGPAVRQGVQGRKPLEYPHGIIGGKDGDGGAKLDPAGAPGDGGKHDLGCGDGKVGAVVFAQANEINADFVGEGGLVQHLTQGDVHGLRRAVRAVADIAEGIEAKGNGGHGWLL